RAVRRAAGRRADAAARLHTRTWRSRPRRRGRHHDRRIDPGDDRGRGSGRRARDRRGGDHRSRQRHRAAQRAAGVARADGSARVSAGIVSDLREGHPRREAGLEGLGRPPGAWKRVRTIKLTIAYDGTGFVGWQRQESGESIQGLIEDALAKIDGQLVTLHGAGRTDAGVHALAQVASARVAAALDDGTLARALNANLPPAIRVNAV